MKTKIKHIQPILSELQLSFEQIYGDDLNNIVLFGSYARGEEGEESDIDLLVVLNKPSIRYGEEIRRFSNHILDLDIKYDCIISAKPTTINNYKTSKFPLFRNVRREGIELMS